MMETRTIVREDLLCYSGVYNRSVISQISGKCIHFNLNCSFFVDLRSTNDLVQHERDFTRHKLHVS